MYSIGKLSKITGLSIPTLRHYDQMGILVPAQRNQTTGYRYYDEEQMLQVQLIKNMKMLGISLEDMKKILAKNDLSYLRGKIAEIRRKIELQLQSVIDIDNYLSSGEHLLRQYQAKGSEAFYDSHPAELWMMPEMDLLCMDVKASFRNLRFFTQCCLEIQNLRDRLGVLQTGALLLIPQTGDIRSFMRGENSFLLCMPVHCGTGSCGKPIRHYESVQVASILSVGNHEELEKVYDALLNWIDENHFAPAGGLALQCVLEPSDTMKPDQYIFRLNLPVEERG